MDFLHYKIIGDPKKFKHQPRPLVRSSTLKFGQNCWNLSHETVPLSTEVVRVGDLGKGKYCNFDTMVKGEKWTACGNADFDESCCMLWNQRLFNFIDINAFVSVPLKQDSRWVLRYFLCLSLFFGVVNFVYILEGLAIENIRNVIKQDLPYAYGNGKHKN